MADVTINSALTATNPYTRLPVRHGPVWVSDTTGYVFLINSGKKVQYQKSTDSGQTWGSAVSVLDTGETTNGYIAASIWFDKWTAGDTGTKIHVVGNDYNGDLLRYRALDTADDSLGTEVTAHSIGGGQTDTAEYSGHGFCSVTKARGGNLFAGFQNNGGGLHAMARSTDGGANWADRTSPFEATGDQYMLIPANDTDNQDIACIYYDTSANTLSFKLHDDSGNTWGTETSIDTGIAAGRATSFWGFDVAVRASDGKAIVVYNNQENNAASDIKAAVCTLTAAGAAVAGLTNILTDTGATGECCIYIDGNTDDLYVAYIKGGTYDADVSTFYKLSTDDGSTWGTETAISETVDDLRMISAGGICPSGASGRFEPSWVNDDLDDLVSNYANSVAITTGGGGGTTPKGWFGKALYGPLRRAVA
jgi:hypothetical protein